MIMLLQLRLPPGRIDLDRDRPELEEDLPGNGLQGPVDVGRGREMAVDVQVREKDREFLPGVLAGRGGKGAKSSSTALRPSSGKSSKCSAIRTGRRVSKSTISQEDVARAAGPRSLKTAKSRIA